MLGDAVWSLTTETHSQSVSTGIETVGSHGLGPKPVSPNPVRNRVLLGEPLVSAANQVGFRFTASSRISPENGHFGWNRSLSHGECHGPPRCCAWPAVAVFLILSEWAARSVNGGMRSASGPLWPRIGLRSRRIGPQSSSIADTFPAVLRHFRDQPDRRWGSSTPGCRLGAWNGRSSGSLLQSLV